MEFQLCCLLIIVALAVGDQSIPIRLPLPKAIQERFPWLNEEPLKTARIVGGQNESIGQAKHQIALLRQGSFICGGSLISPRTVLTAAHCVFGSEQTPSNFKIRYNTLNRTIGPTINVDRIYRHPSYSLDTIDYDVATLILTEDFQPGNNADIITLASSEPESNALLKVTGWGRLTSGGTIPELLQKAQVNPVPRSICSLKWGIINSITPRMLCAHNNKQSTCNGDSGGPLTNSQGHLVGVVSWGPSTCLHSKLPSVFANVATLKNWIDANTY